MLENNRLDFGAWEMMRLETGWEQDGEGTV